MSKINTNKEQPDLLGDLFKRIPEEELPASFRSNVMRQIMLESAKAKKRDERFSLLAAIVASLIMISLAIVSFVYTCSHENRGLHYSICLNPCYA